MRALDTNVPLRLILNDDPAQAKTAAKIIGEPCYIGFGVLIEIVWVLSYTYSLSREAIGEALTSVLDIRTVQTPDPVGVRWAIARYQHHRADFADMLHIVAAKGSASAFASFEKQLAKLAGPDAPLPIERLA